MKRHVTWGWLCMLMLVLAATLATMRPAHAADDDFLDPEQAFAFSAHMVDADTVQVDFKVAPGYYMYRERFAFAAQPEGATQLGTPRIPAGEIKHDPTFDKDMEVYHKPLSIQVPLGQGTQPFTLTVTGQGCAEKGICYPPMDHIVKLQPASGGGYTIAFAGPAPQPGADAAGAGDATSSAAAAGASGQASASGAPAPVGSGSAAAAPAGGGGQGGLISNLGGADDVGLAGTISHLGWLRTAGVFFLLGVLLSLTPCVLPMIPILSTLIVGDRTSAAAATAGQAPHRSRWSGLGLAAAYVLGMSVIYTILGVAAGLSGVGLAAWLQTPWVLALFAGLLAVLALSMFDVFTFQVPASMQGSLSERASRIRGGRAIGAAVMGGISAMIVGPCVAAPLAGALLYISQTGDVVLGGSALFALAWGMGVPLLVVGASSRALLPKPGPWMDAVKRLFGLLLLATAWWMLVPVVPTWLQMIGWAFLAMVGAVMFGAFEALPAGGGAGRIFAKGLGLLLALVSVIWLVGAASGGRDVLQPLSQLAARGGAGAASAGTALAAAGQPGTAGSPNAGAGYGSQAAGAEPRFAAVRSTAELDQIVAQAGKPVMLDFYADWCVSCREMEKFTFSDPAVAQRMAQMTLLRADVTANNADDRALLKRFKLFGPPGIMFFDAKGVQLADARVVGFQDANRFGATLERVLAQ